MNKRKGISPVIATVMLIAMVIVIGLIIFLWFRQLGGETITKFGGKNVELVCGDVEFQAEYVGGELRVLNVGNVPIFKMDAKIEKPGEHETLDLSTLPTSSWSPKGLGAGQLFSADISSYTTDADKLTLIPVLLGSSKEGEKSFTCDENYGYDLYI